MLASSCFSKHSLSIKSLKINLKTFYKMKKVILLFILFISVQSQLKAQNAPLNKQQTLEYIEKVYKSTYKWEEIKVVSVSLDGKILVLILSSGNSYRSNLMLAESLKIDKYSTGYQIGLKDLPILFAIQLEADAIRLKKALEHLIEILKTEKNTDPFGE